MVRNREDVGEDIIVLDSSFGLWSLAHQSRMSFFAINKLLRLDCGFDLRLDRSRSLLVDTLFPNIIVLQVFCDRRGYLREVIRD